MLKKHSKMVVLLIALTFVFSFVASAGAATFSDVAGTGAQSAAIYKLNALGIIDGYTDGTFGPDKTITRAEFAKIAGYLAGLGDVSKGMQSTPSTFKDVKTSDWFNGAVNLAAAQGFVKGYPDGTFRPNQTVTQAEVITVMMRILGYNDNLPGNWPADYIAKAANLGVLDDVAFDASAAATRGIVAVMGAATLDQNVVSYKASDNVFEEATKGGATYTLLSDKFKEATVVEKVLVNQFKVTKDGLKLVYYTYNPTTGRLVQAVGSPLDKDLADKYVVGGAASICSAPEHFADLMFNKDGEITYIGIKDYKVVGPKLSATSILTKLEVTSDGKIKADGVKYDVANASDLIFEGVSEAGLLALTAGTYEGADAYALVLNKDGKVAEVRAWTFPRGGLVDKVVGNKIIWKSNAQPMVVGRTPFTNTNDFTDKTIFVQKDGKPASLSDLQANDAVWVMAGYRNADYYIVASSLKLNDVLTSASFNGAAVNDVTISGLEWKVATGGALYSVDGGSTIEAGVATATIIKDDYDLFGKKVTAVLSPTGKVTALFASASGSDAKMYGVITDITSQMAWTDGTTVRNITLLKEDGKTYTYPISKDTYIKKTSGTTTCNTKIKDISGYTLSTVDALIQPFITPGENVKGLVAVTLKSNGLVDRIEVLPPQNRPVTGNIDTDNKLVNLGSDGWVNADKVVVFDLNNGVGAPAAAVTDLDETKVLGWSELKNATTNMLAWYTKDTAVKYVLINEGALGTSSNYAVFTKYFTDADGDKVSLIYGGKTVSVEVESSVPALTTLKKGDVLEVKWTGSKVDIQSVPFAISSGTTNCVVDVVSSNVVKFDATSALNSVRTDSDTVVFDLSDSDNPVAKTLSDLAAGDKVKVVVGTGADSTLAKVIIIKN